MVIGFLKLELMFPENHSLKEKRRIVKSLISRARDNFNISIGEIGDNDLWQKAKIGISIVGKDKPIVDSNLNKVINFIDNLNIGYIIDQEIEIINV
jgi:hypothetical protein